MATAGPGAALQQPPFGGVLLRVRELMTRDILTLAPDTGSSKTIRKFTHRTQSFPR